MSIEELAKRIHARVYNLPIPSDRAVSRFHAADTMSDLIAHAAADTLLVTSLNNSQLIRIADLMDVPGICLVAGAVPATDFLAHASAAGTAIIVAPGDIADTSRQLCGCLAEAQRGTV
jgi:hypothetical protein